MHDLLQLSHPSMQQTARELHPSASFCSFLPQADPNYKLIAAAYPYMARRLLTDPAPELR